ncbi:MULTISPECIES: hypothetical protein [Streptomyces]|jgi:hypothetical protein|uniref:Secreted protein n=3 Tax=Streptomyces griseoaurantiacus TaxID=68213 RepID=F3NI70_9ACTN|nr:MULTISPECIES: hypothetical protein [Streptomyces]EGG46706.1 hypothetical protein SGM_2834 [Streptomyces griseoaurantiacus M045]MBA5222873.1 hypothetical protein [Streptomyces griseoaurantiacus]MCF0091045.1 hypothetical protein [Streptomyces sp. MH192]MCF0103531.1 hypothetical protein [Streptomyces sp. MH191]MDX3092446.1 hypothetical protein [Streptomyces sp. ME12-02E]
MKSLKALAVVAGSLAVAGAAAPALAATQPADFETPTSINGGVEKALSTRTLDLRPLQHQSDALDTENEDSVLSTVNGVTETLNRGAGAAGLLGGLPLTH